MKRTIPPLIKSMNKFKIKATVHKTNVVLRIFDGAKITTNIIIIAN